MISNLDAAIKAVAPVHGVSIGRKDDKATWRIDFKDEATPEQRAAAQNVLAAFAVGKATSNASLESQIRAIEGRITQRMLREAAAGSPPSQYVTLCDQIAALRAQLTP